MRWFEKSFAWVAGAVALVAVLLFVFRGELKGFFFDLNECVSLPAETSKSFPVRHSSVIDEVEPDVDLSVVSPKLEDADEVMTDEERTETESERRVDAFDERVDMWSEPTEKDISTADVDAFAKLFADVPENRREECLQRALNLIPDENVMLLAVLLVDKSLNRELLELIFNDILNRDDVVKQPILRQVVADPMHPCQKDAAWVLGVSD